MSVCRSTSVAPLTPTYHLQSPTGDKPWYLHRGKLAAALHLNLPLGVTNEGREAISCRSPSYVDLEVDSSRLVSLGSGWSLFARRLNLRDGDMLSCRFDGEITVTVRTFDPSGNSMDPHWQESSSDISTRSRSPTPASFTAPSSGDSSGGGAVSISSEEDIDVKPSIKQARQATL